MNNEEVFKSDNHRRPRITVIGLGLMGVPIADRLRQRGYDVGAWNRGEAGSARGRNLGLKVYDALHDAIRSADLLILTLSDFQSIDSLLFSEESPDTHGKYIVQMGTIAPDESRALALSSAGRGAGYLEAPVLGSVPEAKTGTLILMGGGDSDDFQRVKPVLHELSEEPVLVGPVGAGAALKLAMNQLIASLTVGFAMSLGLVRAEGLSVDLFMGLLRKSALYAPTFDKKLGKMLNHDYANPNFPLKHLIKDIALFRRIAPESGVDSRVLSAILELLEQGRREGFDEADYSSLYEVVNP